MGIIAETSLFTNTPGPNAAEGLEALRQNQLAIRELSGALPPESLTVVDGAISPTRSTVIIDTEGGAPADDLEVINPVLSDSTTLHDGMVIELVGKDDSRVVTVKHGSGQNQISLVDQEDIALSTQYALRLQWDAQAALWRQRIFSQPLKPATALKLGGVKAGDGLSIGEDGTLSANLATAEAAGRVKASETAAAGAVPLGGADGTLDKGWFGTLPDDIEVVNSSGDNWIRYESGIQICWGSEVTNASGGQIITLPVSYVNNAFSVFPATIGNSGSLAAQVVLYVERNATTMFTIWAATGGKPAPGVGFSYFTIGRWK